MTTAADHESFQLPIEAAEFYEAAFVPAFFAQWAWFRDASGAADLDDRALGLALHRQFDLALALGHGLASHTGAVLGEAYRREGPFVVDRLSP